MPTLLKSTGNQRKPMQDLLVAATLGGGLHLGGKRHVVRGRDEAVEQHRHAHLHQQPFKRTHARVRGGTPQKAGFIRGERGQTLPAGNHTPHGALVPPSFPSPPDPPRSCAFCAARSFDPLHNPAPMGVKGSRAGPPRRADAAK